MVHRSVALGRKRKTNSTASEVEGHDGHEADLHLGLGRVLGTSVTEGEIDFGDWDETSVDDTTAHGIGRKRGASEEVREGVRQSRRETRLKVS